MTLKTIMVFALPVIGAVIGWITNYIAIKMLFHPRKKITILGFTLQGLIPKRKSEIAESVSSVVADELFSREDLSKEIQGEEFLDNIHNGVENKVDEELKATVNKFNPLLQKLLPNEFIKELKKKIADEITKVIAKGIPFGADFVQKNIDIKKIVKNKLDSFDTDQLESVVLKVSKRELHTIVWLGGILGFVVGIVQLVFFLLWG